MMMSNSSSISATKVHDRKAIEFEVVGEGGVFGDRHTLLVEGLGQFADLGVDGATVHFGVQSCIVVWLA